MTIATLGEWPTVIGVKSVILAFGFSVLVGVFFGFYRLEKQPVLIPLRPCDATKASPPERDRWRRVGEYHLRGNGNG